MSPQPGLLPDVVGRNRQCRWKEEYVHVPNCKSFLVTENETQHVRRRAPFQHRDASCHQVFFFPAMQDAEGNSRHSDRNIRGTCTIVWHGQKCVGCDWTIIQMSVIDTPKGAFHIKLKCLLFWLFCPVQRNKGKQRRK